MKIDIDSMSRKELEKLKSDVEQAIVNVGDREKQAALDAAEKAAAAHGYSLSDLGAFGGKGKRGGKTKTKAPAKYVNPENPEQTWSGRGRKPGWVNAAEADGKSIESFAI